LELSPYRKHEFMGNYKFVNKEPNIVKKLGWKPKISFDEGIRKIIAHEMKLDNEKQIDKRKRS
jgi:nucleoside-diphosphate-sugar epimerase